MDKYKVPEDQWVLISVQSNEEDGGWSEYMAEWKGAWCWGIPAGPGKFYIKGKAGGVIFVYPNTSIDEPPKPIGGKETLCGFIHTGGDENHIGICYQESMWTVVRASSKFYFTPQKSTNMDS
jgi:hypothetical protein